MNATGCMRRRSLVTMILAAWVYGLAGQATGQSVSVPASAPVPAFAAPVTPPVNPYTFTGSPELQAVTQISATAIKAAQDAVEQTKWVFSIASVVVTSLLAVLAFLGFQNIRNVADSVRDEARRRVDEEIAASRKIISVATQVAVRTQAALRLVYLAEKWAETDTNRHSCLQKAMVAIRDVRSAAETLQDVATQAWSHSFEAYCLRGLKQYQHAISEQLIAMQLSEVDEPLDHYNVACYYALVENAQAASVQLQLAISGGGEGYRTYAKNDADFALVREYPDIIKLVGPPEPINPVDAPEKIAPPLPARGNG